MHWVISWPDFCSRLWEENFLEMWPVSLALITHLSQIQPVIRQGSNKMLPYKDRLRINIFLSLHIIPFNMLYWKYEEIPFKPNPVHELHILVLKPLSFCSWRASWSLWDVGLGSVVVVVHRIPLMSYLGFIAAFLNVFAFYKNSSDEQDF